MLFGLRYLSGYTSREIGDFLGIPPGTVRARLSLAKKHLQAALKDG
jgi:DNA-directed RNA polymerase specialized sigma24 family protein